jgi:GNAT superfamily N-acetyltransferase
MEIQQASSADFVEVLFLVKQCVKDMNNKGLKQWNNSNPSPGQLKHDIEKNTLFLYKEMGVAKGMINLTDEISDEYREVDWKSKPDKVLYVKRFAIHPLWQDSDVSDKLLEFAEKYAKEHNYTSIRLDALDNYPIDEKFFESRKFTFAGTFQTSFQRSPYSCFEKSL